MEIVKGPEDIREFRLMQLMERYEKDLLRLCIVYLRDLTMAEDAVQETFLKAYRAMEDFRAESSEKTWLTRIAVNTCKDMRRSAWYRFVDRRVSLDALPEPVQPASQESIELTMCIMALPRKEMEAVMLYYYQGMTLEEIAFSLGISSPAVSARLKKGRERLKAMLQEGWALPDEPEQSFMIRR